MSNNGKSLTNVSFRAKMLEVIDKLKDQDKTALVRHVDDFEGLNKDTFEAGMNALIDAVPAGGGGGGGGTGDGGYVVTFGINFQNNEVTCDKTIEDIIAHANNHIIGRLAVKDLSMDGAPFKINIYCDNLKFDYQQFNSDDPEIAPMLPEYTYLGFSGDAFIMSILNEGPPRTNTPVEDGKIQYYKTCISFYYLFASEGPHWEFNISDINEEEEKNIPTSDVSITGDNDFWGSSQAADYTREWNSEDLVLEVTAKTNTIIYPDGTTVTGPIRNARIKKLGIDVTEQLLNAFMPDEPNYYAKSGLNISRKTALSAPSVSFKNAYDTRPLIKPAQIDMQIDLSTYLQPSRFNLRGIFNVAEIRSFPVKNNVTGYYHSGHIILYMDQFLELNNKERLIRHRLRIYRENDSSSAYCDYAQLEIPWSTYDY